MSLDWNVQKVKREIAFPDDKMSDKTHSLIWLTLVIQIGEITEKNAVEFFRRVNLWKHGIASQDYGITLQDVRDHIGLKTNVSTRTPKQWDAWFKTRLFAKTQEKAYEATQTADA